MSDPRRERLLRRVGELSPAKLDLVERFVDLLEYGDSSPLSHEPSRLIVRHRPPRTETRGSSPYAKHWPHAPLHRISDAGTYLVTAGTLYKEHWFHGPQRLDLLESALLQITHELGWRVEAWAVFSNHYHFVAHCRCDSASLKALIKRLHAETARVVNRLDCSPSRQVWHNYWDTKLTFEKSYLARLNYVHQNAVKHRLVAVANQYRWCSAAWFERTATPAQVATVYGFKTDRLQIHDDFEPR